MERRAFMKYGTVYSLAALSVRGILAQECMELKDTPNNPVHEFDFPNDYPAFLKARYPFPKLTSIINFKPTASFINSKLHPWGRHPGGIARVNRALELWGAVWSSKEFKSRLEKVPSLIWRYNADHPDSSDRTISGKDLYSKLTATKNPEMKLVMVTNTHSLSSESAASGDDSTNLQYQYASTDATVYELTNTLSHEYTHYAASGSSLDASRTGDSLSNYVSYGIGGTTENMAAGQKLYCYELPASTP
jgi:hypothetical protein